MSQRQALFEELIGDVDAFRLMLEGAFKQWEGSYDVLLADTGEYLFHPKADPSFRSFCRRLRSRPEGELLCWKCDKDAALRAANRGEPIVYSCHASLIDIAVPILVAGDLVATVFCGQIRPAIEMPDTKSWEKVQDLEDRLGFDSGELIALWKDTPRIAEDEVEKTVQRVWRLVNYISELGQERLELRKAHQKDRLRLRESEVLESVAKELGGLASNWTEFWTKVHNVLEQTIDVVGASCAMLLTPTDVSDSPGELVIRAVAGLPHDRFNGRAYMSHDTILQRVVDEDEVKQVPFGDYEDPSTICGSIRAEIPSLADSLDEAVMVRVGLGNHQAGLLLLFLNEEHDTSGSLSMKEEKGMIVHLASLIGTAHHNCFLYQAQQREMVLRRSWLRKVTHQLLAPIHGLQGYAEDAWRRLWWWQKRAPRSSGEWTENTLQRWTEELRRWEHSFESIVWSSHYAARLASNLAWMVYTHGEEESQELASELVEDAGGLLIRCARDFQGLARERGLRKVEVNTATMAKLDGQLCVDENLFRQAVGNLLDNAVKYSDKGTDIIIDGGIVGGKARLRVINVGIRLSRQEIDRVFDEGYRTKEASLRHPAGTGIGLTVARQIIELHRGTLTAQASRRISPGWQTQFTIYLPISPEECQ